MSGLHSDIAEANRHEAKGITAGANNSVCMKNGSGNQEFVAAATAFGTGLVSFDNSNVGTPASTSETTLYTHTILADTLTSAGEGVKTLCVGNYGANANNKTIRIKVNGTVTALTTALAYNAGQWELFAEVYYIDNATAAVRAFAKAVDGGSSATFFFVYNAEFAVDFTSNFDIIITGENGTATALDVEGEFTRSSIIT